MDKRIDPVSADDIPALALSWFQAGQPVALATVLSTWGSAPRPVGAQLVVAADGRMMGSVSGGCVEGAVVAEALEAMQDGQPRVLRFGVSDGDAFAVGLACGGEISVLVEPVGPAPGLSPALLAELVAARAAHQPICLQTAVPGGQHRLHRTGLPEFFASGQSGWLSEGQFITVHNPPSRMVIIGAVHIAQALAPMAQLAGFGVTIIDPRAAFGSPERFPGQHLVADWPDAALAAHGLDAGVAVVCLTHDPKLDDPALIPALASPAFYVGALGSKRTHEKRVERLLAAGVTPAQMARLHAPIGLDLGSRSPAEIAVSILAQVIENLRKPERRR